MRRLLSVVLACAALSQGAAQIKEAEFAGRRRSVLSAMDSSSALVLRAAEPRRRSLDVDYRYRQESNLLYLTGLSAPKITLVLVPRGITMGDRRDTVLLFVPPSLRPEVHVTGGRVLDAGEFGRCLDSICTTARTLYVSAPDIGFVDDWLNGRPLFLDREVRKEVERKYPGLKLKSAGPLFGPLRARKSDAEVALIRKAIDLTGAGLRKAMEICRPGLREYELQAAVEYELVRGGAREPAFPSIIGSGRNALEYHYADNRDELKCGDVVVMDVGAEYDGYSADVTRTVPTSGKFTDAQRVLYEAVHRAQEEVIRIIRPGLPWSALDKKAVEILAEAGLAKYAGHGVSHHLGIDAHDPGPLDTLRAGMVITVEPGVYIPVEDTTAAPAWRGIGIRIEDDVLVTSEGCVVLSADIPKDIYDVEKALRKP